MEMIRVRPVRGMEDVKLLQQLAEADGHVVIAPTYYVQKGDQIIGSIGVTPAIHIWLDTQRTMPKDSLIVLNTYENILDQNGGQVICVPCTDSSPFRPYLPRVGYLDGGKMNIFLKNLKG